VIVVDEYLAVRIVFGDWPDDLPDDDDIALPASRHWRLLQRIHNPSGGQLTAIVAGFTPDELMALRFLILRCCRSSIRGRCSTMPPPSTLATTQVGG